MSIDHNSTSSKTIGLVCTALLFCICVAIGLYLAQGRRIWEDEYYSLVASILPRSYLNILGTPFFSKEMEGNSSPLFYLLQKIWCDLIQYRVPAFVTENDTHFTHLPSQLWLRIPTITFISLSISGTFYFFYRYYSTFSAFLSLVVSLSTTILWTYWTEMRPYALWIFLSTLQSMSLIRLIENHRSRKAFLGLCFSHYLLSFTIALSAIQISIASLVYGLFISRKPSQIFLVGLLPFLICVAYALAVPGHYQFHVGADGWNVMLGSIYKSRIVILGIVFCASCWLFLQKNLFSSSFFQKGLPYFVFASLIVIAAAALLEVFKLREIKDAPGFWLPSRYFLFQASPGIFAVTYLSTQLLQEKNLPLKTKILFLFPIALMIGYQCYRTFLDANVN